MTQIIDTGLVRMLCVYIFVSSSMGAIGTWLALPYAGVNHRMIVGCSSMLAFCSVASAVYYGWTFVRGD